MSGGRALLLASRYTNLSAWSQPRALGCLLAALSLVAWPGVAAAQTQTTYSNATGGGISDVSCNLPIASQLTRTFTVPTSYIVGDVNVGILLDHTYRSDLRIFLTSPAGTSVSLLPWTTNVQSGNNLNDLFDDEAVAAITSHNATVNDPLTPTPPPYNHSFRPANPLSAFDGQDAAGTWSLRICDAVSADTGNFRRADLLITSTSLSTAKSSTVVSDPINNATNPKAIPGATMQYCILVTNNGNAVTAASTNILVNDPLPLNTTYVTGSLRSGPSCAGATIVEDDDNAGADESDPFGMAFSGGIVSGSAASLATNATFAMVFQVTIN